MKLKFTYLRAGGDAVDLVATVDATVTVGDLATAVAKRDPGSPGRKNVSRPGEQYSLRVHAGHASGPATVLSAGLPLILRLTSCLRSSRKLYYKVNKMKAGSNPRLFHK